MRNDLAESREWPFCSSHHLQGSGHIVVAALQVARLDLRRINRHGH